MAKNPALRHVFIITFLLIHSWTSNAGCAHHHQRHPLLRFVRAHHANLAATEIEAIAVMLTEDPYPAWPTRGTDAGGASS